MPVRRAMHRAGSRRRNLGVLCGVALVPVAALVAIYLSGGGSFLRLGLTRSSPPAASLGHDRAVDAPGPSPVAASPTPGPSPSAKPHRARHRHHPVPPPTPSPSANQTSTSPPTTSPPSGQESEAVSAVLALINQARAQAGLSAYTITAGLDSSSAAHNARMADGCGLSHQCPGEPALGTRETDAGVTWTAAGENIGEG